MNWKLILDVFNCDLSHFALQRLGYVEYTNHYHNSIKEVHIKYIELNPIRKRGIFGGYEEWGNGARRYPSHSDSQVDFKTTSTKLMQHGCDLWTVIEWGHCIKSFK